MIAPISIALDHRSPAFENALNPAYDSFLSILQACERRPLHELHSFWPIAAGISPILLNGRFVRLLGLRCLASHGFPKGAVPIVEYQAEDGVAALAPLRAVSSLRGRTLENPYELAIGGRNQDAVQLALLHISGHLLKCDVRAKGTWPRLHHLFNELLGIAVQGLPLQ